MEQDPTVFEIESQTTDTTIRIGEALGSVVQSGDVIGLVGRLGAGKTWLAKSIAHGLGVPRHEYVNSPAYDIIHEYHGRLPVYHMDFYRIDDIGDDEYLWLEEYLEKPGVCIAEWADKFLAELSDSYLKVEIDWDPVPDTRMIRFTASDQHYSRIIARLRSMLDAES